MLSSRVNTSTSRVNATSLQAGLREVTSTLPEPASGKYGRTASRVSALSKISSQFW
jgi:hypothetical protein